jgi:hypothetical protein
MTRIAPPTQQAPSTPRPKEVLSIRIAPHDLTALHALTAQRTPQTRSVVAGELLAEALEDPEPQLWRQARARELIEGGCSREEAVRRAASEWTDYYGGTDG